MNAQTDAASVQLAHARVSAEEGAATTAVANSAVDEVRGRIAALEAERCGIVGARKAGQLSPMDGPRLAEIQADKEGLAEIESERLVVASAAAAESGRLNQFVTAAAFNLANARDNAELTGLKAVATELADRLMASIVEIGVVSKRLGQSRAAWLPTAQLADSILRMDLERRSRGLPA